MSIKEQPTTGNSFTDCQALQTEQLNQNEQLNICSLCWQVVAIGKDSLFMSLKDFKGKRFVHKGCLNRYYLKQRTSRGNSALKNWYSPWRILAIKMQMNL